MTPSQAKQFWEAAEFSEQKLLLMQDTNCKPLNYSESLFYLCFLFKITDLDVCQLCLVKQGDLFHDLCLVRSKMLDAAFDSAIQLSLWDEAIQFGIPLIEAYKLWYGDRHPLTAILLLKLFKILLLIPESRNDSIALKYYEEAVAIIEVTHGKTSSFYQHEVKPLLHQVR